MSKSRGFTLIELLVTISIIAVLAAIGLVIYSRVLRQVQDSKRKSDLRTIQSALEQYYADNFYYPSSITFGSALSAGGKTYLNTVPTSPSSPAYCYKPLKSTEDCSLASSSVDCNNASANLADRCSSYCLYAQLEDIAEGTGACTIGASTISTYNLTVTPP